MDWKPISEIFGKRKSKDEKLMTVGDFMMATGGPTAGFLQLIGQAPTWPLLWALLGLLDFMKGLFPEEFEDSRPRRRRRSKTKSKS